jgi:hypothetical protein
MREYCDDCDRPVSLCECPLTDAEVKRWEINEAYEERAWDEERRYRNYIVRDWLDGASPQILRGRYCAVPPPPPPPSC